MAAICVICQVELKKEPFHQLSCKHEYHARCIREYYKATRRVIEEESAHCLKPKCPICRATIHSEDIGGNRLKAWRRMVLAGQPAFAQLKPEQRRYLTRTVEARVGAGTTGKKTNGSPTQYNEKLWVTLSEVINFVEEHRLRTNGYSKTIKITSDPEKCDQNNIAIFSVDCHAFVARQINSIVYLADGTNELTREKSLKTHLERLFAPLETQSIKYEDQMRLDECASSAAIIALEFLKKTNITRPPSSILAPSNIRSILRERWHGVKNKKIQGGAESTNLRANAQLNEQRREAFCRICSKRFHGKGLIQRKSAHEQHCTPERAGC